MPLADLHIDELVLRLPGRSPADGERLGVLVRERLERRAATGAVPAHGGPLDLAVDVGRAASLESIADAIVAKLAVQLGLEG